MQEVTLMIVSLTFLSTSTFTFGTSRLSVTSTDDVIVLCSVNSSMEICGKEKVTFSDVQIFGRFGSHGNEEYVLATLTRTGARQSNLLKVSYPMSFVSGNVTEIGEYLEAWITLTIAGCEYGQFKCVVSYVDDTSDSNAPSNCSLDPVNYTPGNKTVKTNGVSLSVLPGLSLLCEHTAKDQAASGLSNVTIRSEKRDLVLATWSGETSSCAEGVLCRPTSVVASYMSFRVHVLYACRADWGEFVCTIHMHGEEKPTTIRPTEDVWPTACLNAYIAIGLLAVVTFALAIVCLVLAYNRKDSKEAADQNATTDPAENSNLKTGDLMDTDDSKELHDVFVTQPLTSPKSSKARKRDKKKRRTKTAK